MKDPVTPDPQEQASRPLPLWQQIKILWAHSSDLLFGYDYFIAHRSTDGKPYATRLHSVLTEQGNELDCFLDLKHYGAGGLLREMQTRALRNTTRLIVIVTDHVHDPKSHVLSEVKEFRKLHPASQIVPVGSRTHCGEQWNGPTSELMQWLPPYPDAIWVVEDETNLAQGKVSAESAAKLLNDFSETRRSTLRQRWMKGAVALLILLALSASAAAGTAFWQRGIARENFAAAKGAADGLVVDIARGLRDVEGMRSSAVRQILTQADKTFDRLLKRVPNNPDLLKSKASMYHEFVTTYLAVGDTDSATKAATAGLQTTEKLLALLPHDESVERTHGLSLMKLGDTEFEVGKMKESRQSHQLSLALRQRLLERHPQDLTLLRDVSVSLMRLSEIDEAEGDIPSLAARTKASTDIRRQIALKDPTKEVELQVGLIRLLDTALLNHDTESAKATYQEAHQIATRLIQQHPTDTRHARNYAIVQQRWGNIGLTLQDYAQAESGFSDCYERITALANIDTDNQELKHDIAITLLKLGLAAKGSQNLELAQQRFKQAIEKWKVITDKNPDVYQWKADLAETYLELARVETGPAHLQHLAQAKAILEKLKEKGAAGKEEQAWLDEIATAQAKAQTQP